MTSWFRKFSEKKGITGESLKLVVKNTDAGNADADLGGGVYKCRLARKGEGKSGGYRIILCFRKGSRAFFVYGYAKSKKNDITDRELETFRKAARLFFSYTDEELRYALSQGKFSEIL